MSRKDYFEIEGKLFVSTRVAAIVCGVTVQTFHNWRRDSDPPPYDNERGLVPLDKLGEWIRAEQVIKPGRGGAGFPYMPNVDKLYKNTPNLANEAPETRLKRLQADKLQMEIDKTKGDLLPVDEVQQVWTTILARVRAKLLRIPVVSAPLITGLSDPHEVQQKLTDQVAEALEELATGEDDTPPPISAPS